MFLIVLPTEHKNTFLFSCSLLIRLQEKQSDNVERGRSRRGIRYTRNSVPAGGIVMMWWTPPVYLAVVSLFYFLFF